MEGELAGLLDHPRNQLGLLWLVKQVRVSWEMCSAAVGSCSWN